MSRFDSGFDQFPVIACAGEGWTIDYRSARSSTDCRRVTHVLLHGIGSGSASWLTVLPAIAAAGGVCNWALAWDAPGYGGSSPLSPVSPNAADYATRMWQWLDQLGESASGALTLVGHSLGCLMAASAASARPKRVSRLVLLSPARGYGNASAAEREQKLATRLANLRDLGPAMMAQKRAAAMVSPSAPPDVVAFVAQIMSQIHPDGYAQAARMLANAELGADLAHIECPLVIASGEADTVTPMVQCQDLARSVGVAWHLLGAVGHSCVAEAPAAVVPLLHLHRDTYTS